MAYFLEDIYMGISGDFEVAANGDLRMANSFESVKQTANFIARTDKGEFTPDPRIGGSLGYYIGDNINKDMLVSMEKSLIDNLSRFILRRSDFQVHCMPISQQEVGVFIAIGGQYLDSDGNILSTYPEVISFSFPYGEGAPSIN